MGEVEWKHIFGFICGFLLFDFSKNVLYDILSSEYMRKKFSPLPRAPLPRLVFAVGSMLMAQVYTFSVLIPVILTLSSTEFFDQVKGGAFILGSGLSFAMHVIFLVGAVIFEGKTALTHLGTHIFPLLLGFVMFGISQILYARHGSDPIFPVGSIVLSDRPGSDVILAIFAVFGVVAVCLLFANMVKELFPPKDPEACVHEYMLSRVAPREAVINVHKD